jgi:hypothetical protein
MLTNSFLYQCILFVTLGYFKSLGIIIFFVFAILIWDQQSVSNDNDTNPAVGTLATKTSPNLLTKFVMASLCPKE